MITSTRTASGLKVCDIYPDDYRNRQSTKVQNEVVSGEGYVDEYQWWLEYSETPVVRD